MLARVSLLLLLLVGCRERPAAVENGAPAASAAPASAAASVVPPDPPQAVAVPTAKAEGMWIVDAAGLRAQIAASGHKAVIVNVWASWCGPCRRELPMLQALAMNLAPREVGVFFVSVDDGEHAPDAARLLRDSGISHGTYIVGGSLEAFKAAIHPRWPGMIPATFLFDGAGKMRYFWGGPVYESDILPVVDGFLAGRNIDGEADLTIAPGKTTP